MSEPSRNAVRERLWAEFSPVLEVEVEIVKPNGSKAKEKRKRFTPTPNRTLEGRYENPELDLALRFDALLERASLGNWCLFACDRDWETGEAKPLGQAEFARILGTDRRRISELVKLRQGQGVMLETPAEKNGRYLMLNLDPAGKAKEEQPDQGLSWKDFRAQWDAAHPDLVARSVELRALAAPILTELNAIERARLSDFKKLRREEPDSPDEVSDTSRTEAPDSADTSEHRAPDSPDKTSGTPRTGDLHSEGEDIVLPRDTRTRVRTQEVKPIGSRSVSQPLDRPTDEQDPSLSPVPEEAAERMATLLLDELGERFPAETPGRTLCLQTIQALGDADWDSFRAKLRAHRWERKDTMGLARSLAGEVRERWIADQPRRRRDREIDEAEADRLTKLNAEVEAEEAARRHGDEIWASLTEAERSTRVATQLEAVVRTHPRMAPQFQDALAAQLAKHEFVQQYVAKLDRVEGRQSQGGGS